MQQRLRTRGRSAASAGYRYLRLVLCVLGVGMAIACDSGAPPPAAVEQPPIPKPPGQRLQEATLLAQGKALYDQYCATCHGQQAVGTPNWRQRDGTGRYPPPPLNGTAHAWHHPWAQLRDIIKHGGPPGESNMPAFQNQLSDAQIDAIIIWLQSLWSDDIYKAWYDIDQQYRAWANENEYR